MTGVQTCALPISYAPVAQNIHNFPTIWQPATLLANDSDAQAVWQKIASGVPNILAKGQLNGSTVNVTYDSANDSDCYKWHFLSPALPFQEGERGEERRVTVRVSLTIGTRAFGDMPQARGCGSTATRLSPGKPRSHVFLYAPSPVTDDMGLVTHHVPLFD